MGIHFWRASKCITATFDLSVASPVLFSVANIEQPGTFDYYNMAEFSTMGVVLFMQLPSPGNNLANLRMMIRAAKTIAEDLGGVVLTDQQEIFDDMAEQDYLSRHRIKTHEKNNRTLGRADGSPILIQ